MILPRPFKNPFANLPPALSPSPNKLFAPSATLLTTFRIFSIPGANAISPIFALTSLIAKPVSVAIAAMVSLNCSFLVIASSVAPAEI